METCWKDWICSTYWFILGLSGYYKLRTRPSCSLEVGHSLFDFDVLQKGVLQFKDDTEHEASLWELGETSLYMLLSCAGPLGTEYCILIVSNTREPRGCPLFMILFWNKLESLEVFLSLCINFWLNNSNSNNKKVIFCQAQHMYP